MKRETHGRRLLEGSIAIPDRLHIRGLVYGAVLALASGAAAYWLINQDSDETAEILPFKPEVDRWVGPSSDSPGDPRYGALERRTSHVKAQDLNQGE